MSTADIAAEAKLPLDDKSRSFDEPWQAQAFCMVVELHKQGNFAWDEWVQMFSRHIKANPPLPGESTNDTYYRQLMLSLEEMAGKVGDISEDSMDARIEEWRQAYLNTPHGEAVMLAHATCPPKQSTCGGHHHGANLEPVAVAAAIT